MNARPNDFRRVAYSEFENDHVHRLFRHFPELQTSLKDVKAMQQNIGRNWTDRDPIRKERPREIIHKSTHRLGELSKSSLDECRAPMDEMRRVLIQSRDQSKTFSVSGNGSRASSTGSLALQNPSVHSKDQYNPSLDASAHPENTDDAHQADPPNSSSHTNTPYAVALASAEHKLAKAALSFNPLSTVNVLVGFQGMPMTLSELNSQLKRSLSINLTKSELQALFDSMDVDGSGFIDGVEFTRYFLSQGVEERKKHKLGTLQRTWQAENERRCAEEKETDMLVAWQAAQVKSSRPEDEESVMRKLENIALKWDSCSDISDLKLKALDSYLTPYDFKVQLARSLGLKVTGSECGALLNRFSSRPNEAASVNGNAFLKFFTRLKKETKIEHKKVLEHLAARKARVRGLGQAEVVGPALGR